MIFITTDGFQNESDCPNCCSEFRDSNVSEAVRFSNFPIHSNSISSQAHQFSAFNPVTFAYHGKNLIE